MNELFPTPFQVWRATPENIRKLAPNQVFCFGSNLAGRHGKGAAKLAVTFGAIRGQGKGLMGQCYAVATKDHALRVLPLAAIEPQIDELLRFAAANPQLQFLVTKIGCGLALYSPDQIRPFFLSRTIPPNVVLPVEFQAPR